MSPFQRIILISVVSVILSACSGGSDDVEPVPDQAAPADFPLDPDLFPVESTINDSPDGLPGPLSQGAKDVNQDADVQNAPVNDAVDRLDEDASRLDALNARDVLPSLNLPLAGSTVGDYKLVNAYPELSFQEALLIAAVPGEDRLVVVEQTGLIKVFDDDPQATSSEVILDIRESIVFSGEQGLLGLAFDPDFTSNRLVYLNYTTANPDLTVVSRMSWDAVEDMLDASSEQIILTVEQPFHSHNAGMIAFGPDNYLYIALGDGGDGGDPFNFAQDRSSLLGSLLRIDVHPANPRSGYAIPPDNPFVGEPGVREEIFAYGFRNPFRFSFDRANGDIWLGDVGQEHREEINFVVSGGNYGWRVFEGSRENERALNTLPDSAFTAPVHEYDHASGLSVIGGYVYRGTRVNSLSGRYLFADFYSGVITGLNWDGQRVTSHVALASVDGPTSFGETHDGDVLVVSRYQGIYRFEEQEQTISFPEKLSETGLFEDLESLTPVPGLVEYRTAHPFWSDGAAKRRWIGVPEFKRIGFSLDDWSFPIGSVSVKHFFMDMRDGDPLSSRRLETRVLYHTQQGWQGVSYRWNRLQNEATIVRDRLTQEIFIERSDGSIRVQDYEYPGTRDCSVCHNRASSFLLGLESRQMNIEYLFGSGMENQISALNQLQLFDRYFGLAALPPALPSVGNQTASIETRARAYLDVNCSHCHQPGGPAATSLDLRFEISESAMGVIDATPQNGSLGLSDAKLVSPGDRENSTLWLRMNTLDSERMPPVATHRIDETGVDLIGQWIDGLR